MFWSKAFTAISYLLKSKLPISAKQRQRGRARLSWNWAPGTVLPHFAEAAWKPAAAKEAT